MNADHADALVTLCQRADVVSAPMTAVDRYGFEVIADLGHDRREAVRIGFRSEQTTADGVRRELVGMLHQARSSAVGYGTGENGPAASQSRDDGEADGVDVSGDRD